MTDQLICPVPSVEATYLRLVLEAQPAAAFEEPLAAARALGDDAALREVERTRALALRLKDELDGLKARQAAMHALHQSSIDLASLRDPDTVLTAIAERARRLLDCDGAEVHVINEDSTETEIRAGCGNISDLGSSQRMRFGEGLAGLVAQTGAPQMTENYSADQRFKHTKLLDDIVRAEQVSALLGVPLKLAGKVVGVLMVGSRTERTFTPDEVNLLSALAVPAAIAMETANLLADTQHALTQLGQARDQLSRDAAALKREGEAHDRLMQLTLHGGGIADVATALKELLGGSVLIIDQHNRVIAQSETDPAAILTADDVAAVTSSKTSRSPGVHGRDHVAPMVAGDRYLGVVFHRALPEPDPDRIEFAEHPLRTVERAAVVCALLLLFQESLAEAESRVHDQILNDLLRTPVGDAAEFKGRLQRAGVHGDTFCVVAATPDGDVPRGRLSIAARTVASQLGALATLFGHEAVVLVACDDPSGAVASLAKSLGDHLGQEIFAAASDPFQALDHAPEALRQAQRCLSATRALRRTGGMSSRELGFVGLLLGDPAQSCRFVDDVLGRVLDYDARRGTELIETLDVYFATGRSIGKAADALIVHPNTVTQRLGRVKELLGEHWLEDPQPSLELQLALHIHRCMDRQWTNVPRDTAQPPTRTAMRTR